MPLPPERVITGTYVNPVNGEPYDGTDGSNYVIFEPVPDRWTDQDGNQILLGGGKVTLDEDGHFSESVVRTDAEGVLPAEGRVWRLRQFVAGAWSEGIFTVPDGTGPLDITDVLSVDICGVDYVPVPGPPGPQGPPGPADGPPGPQGPEGASAYEVAVEEGFVGTEAQWLASLQGEQGEQGPAGATGAEGPEGPSAYEVAVEEGFSGTEAEWLASLVGPPGADGEDGAPGATGPQGDSAYEVAVENGFVGTEEEWLESLVGPQGEPGIDGGLDTGITTGGDISANISNPLAIDISPLTGRIVDYLADPITITEVTNPSILTVELDSVAQDRTITWFLMDADLNVFQQEARPSPEDRRNFIVLGMAAQDDGEIFLAQSLPTIARQPVNQLYDLMDSIGAFGITGNDVSPNGANLQLNVGSGQVFSRGWNHFDGPSETNNPHIVTTLGATPAPWTHALRASDLEHASASATVDVGHYDNGGVLTAVGGDADTSVVHQLWMFPTNEGSEFHVLQYGQQVFDTLDDAVSAIGTTPFTVNPALPGSAIQLGFLAVKGVATDLSDATEALFVKAGKFGSGPGGGASVDLSGYAQLAGAEFTGQISSLLADDSDIAQSSRTTVNTNELWRRLTTGEMQWGSGSGPMDTFLRRLGAGLLAVINSDFLIGAEDAKSYRFRQSGGSLDLDASGADLFLSVFELVNFLGEQYTYLRLESGSFTAHASGKWVFGDGPFDGSGHTLDGVANEAGFFGATPVARQTVAGDRTTGEAIQSLLAGLEALGLIDDTSTAGPAVVETVNGEAGPDVILDADDVGAVDTDLLGVADGVATLGSDGKVPTGQLPTPPVVSVNTETGAVVLDAVDVGAIPIAQKAAVNGVASLDGSGKVPSAQLPTAPVTSVNGETGAVTLDAADVGALTQAVADGLYMAQDSLWINGIDHGVVGDGATDDAPAINAILDTSPAGSVITLPPKVYATDEPIIVPPGKTLMGLRSDLMTVTDLYEPNVQIKPLATFTGVAAIRFLDATTGGYADISGEQRVLNLTLDGGNLAAGVDGIQAKGNVQNVALRDVTIRRFPNSGIYCGLEGGVAPYSWRMHRVMLDNNHAHGMFGERMVDLTAVDCQAIGNWSNGWMLQNAANSQMLGCRAEWNGNHGFYLSGDWGDGAGAGGMLLSGCSTDRNGFNGVYLDCTGTPPIVISNLMTRRDGRNGGTGGGGYAGLAVNGATMPVIVGDWTNFPGVDDGGASTNSPQYAGSFTNAEHVQVDNSYLHAATAAINDGGGNGTLRVGGDVIYAVGTTDTFTRSVAPSQDIVVAASDSRSKSNANFICTGTNDHLVIQAAVDLVDAAPGKGRVRLLDGTFVLGATINWPDGVGLGLVGSGWGTVIKVGDDMDDMAITFSGGETRSTFSDFTIDGNLAEQTTGPTGGIWAPGAVECVFQRVHFTSCASSGLMLGPMTGGAFGHNNIVTHCLFDNAMASTLEGNGIYTTSSDENFIVACDFQFLGGSGAVMASIYDTAGTQTILGCNFVGGANGRSAIRVQDASATKITACNFDGVGGDAIFLAATNCVVEGNTIFGVGAVGTAGTYSGVHLEYAATGNLIANNSVSSHTTNGSARSLIREESVGDSGNNLITGNMLITKGTLSVAALDVNAPGTLCRDNMGGGVKGDVTPPLRTAAGAISDATFAPLVPTDGTMGIDTTNKRLYARISGTWSYTAVTSRAMPGAMYVAASNAPAADKAMADYVCDGTADEVQIQAAVDAVQAVGGGVVQLSPGDFAIAATIEINGMVDEDDARTVTLRGCGQQVTNLNVASNVNGITISDWAQVNLELFGVFIAGSGIGIRSVGVEDGGTNNTMSFWHSSFRNLRINGAFNGAYTTWGMELDVPWRSTFENIEIEGCRNGIKIINDSTVQNAGDCVFSRFFVEIVGNDGYALYFDSIDGNMNQNIWNMFEAGANGTGCTGIYLGGTVGTASQRFYGLNLEQFQTGINVANGESNEFYCNYVTGDGGQAGNKMFVCGANSYNNLFQAKWVNVEASGSLKVIEDNNTTSNTPNIFERIRIENNTGGTVTYSKTASTVFRDITTFNTGNAMPAGLLQYPLSTVNRSEFTHEDHGYSAWTQDPATCPASGTVTSGVVYLSKIKVVNRSTVVSTVAYAASGSPAGMTSGQNFVGIYSSAGTLLATSVDQTTNFGSAGAKTATLASPVTLAVGYYYVAFLANGTTPPSFMGGSNSFQTGLNSGLTTGTARSLSSGTTQTALPASITLSSGTMNGNLRWAAFL